MKLKAHLDTSGQTYSGFARRIGTTAEAVRRYAEGERIPAPDVMVRIAKETDGGVMPNDFYPLPAGTTREPAA